MNANMKPIDPEKLRKQLKSRNLNARDVSIYLGHGPNYVSDALRRERLSSGGGENA